MILKNARSAKEFVVVRLLQMCGCHGVPLARALARQCQCRLIFQGRHWLARALASGTEYHHFAIDGLLRSTVLPARPAISNGSPPLGFV
jgi:hypothetical protein